MNNEQQSQKNNPIPPPEEKKSNRSVRSRQAIAITLVLIILASISIIFINRENFSFSGTEQSDLPQTRPNEIKGTLITLKKLKEEYFIDFHNMLSMSVRRDMEYPEHMPLDWTIRLLREEKEKDTANKTMFYCIFENKTNRLIGEIQIRDKTDADRGQMGCWINENYRGQGYIQEAIKLATAVYFRTTDEDHFIAHVRLWNPRSYKALKKAGFVDVGYFNEDNERSRYILEMRK
jgi:RimJ/RimL family protein N-acetyltransferase